MFTVCAACGQRATVLCSRGAPEEHANKCLPASQTHLIQHALLNIPPLSLSFYHTDTRCSLHALSGDNTYKQREKERKRDRWNWKENEPLRGNTIM